MDVVKKDGKYIVFIHTFYRQDMDVNVQYNPVNNTVTLRGCASTLVGQHFKDVYPGESLDYWIVEINNPCGHHVMDVKMPDYIRDIDYTGIKSYVRPNAVVIEFPMLNSIIIPVTTFKF